MFGERVDCEQIKIEPQNYANHIVRYAFAMPYLGDSVLDFGCGIGYGVALMHLKSPLAYGYDIAEEAITEANSLWNLDNFTNSIDNLLDKYDTITAFEVIEHLDDPKKTLVELLSKLNPEGTLLFSLPINCPAPFHVTNWTVKQVKDFVKEFKAEIFVQKDMNFYTLTKEWEDIESDDISANRPIHSLLMVIKK